MTTAAQRHIIKDYADSRGLRYRITAAGEVHMYGEMPNTNQTGWYFFSCRRKRPCARSNGGVLKAAA